MLTLPLLASLMMSALQPEGGAELEPEQISEVDAIACRLDAQSYQRFAFAVEGEEQIAKKRGWRKVSSANPLLLEFDLPAPITLAETYRTRRIAFTADGILAILDLADPNVIAAKENIENTMSAEPMIAAIVASGKATRAEAEAMIQFRKFLGERVVQDITEPAPENGGYGSRTVIAHTISNVTTHPGKTLYGCSYRMEILDDNGAPL